MSKHVLIPFWWFSLLLILMSSTNRATARSSSIDSERVYLPLVNVSSPVTISETTAQRTRAGTFRLTGEVTTTITDPVYAVVLELRLYDAQDRLVDMQRYAPVFEATLPGQPNPFDIGTNISSDMVARYDILISSWNLSSSRVYYPLTVNVMTVYGDGTYVHVSGDVRNDSPRPVDDVQIAVWISTQRNGITRQPLVPTLAPGATAQFSASLLASYASEITPDIPVKVVAQGSTSP